MLNLRDPKINRYAMETGNTYGSPPPTEPLALTAVVMNDTVPTFQTGGSIGKFLRIYCDNP